MKKHKNERRPPSPLRQPCVVFLKNDRGVRTAIKGARKDLFGLAMALKKAGELSVVIRL